MNNIKINVIKFKEKWKRYLNGKKRKEEIKINE